MAFSDAAKCTAVAKRTGQRCGNVAVTGYTVCYQHGAGSPRNGRAGGRPVQHGRYSKFLPDRLAAHYQETLGDAKLLELRDEIALVVVRQGELLSHLDSGEALQHWKDAQKAHSALKSAIADKDSVAMLGALSALESALAAGLRDYAVWQEIVEMSEARRKLVESERKRLVEMQQMITAERAMILLGAITAIIKEHVHDHSTLAAISTSIRGLVSVGTGDESES